MIQAVSKSGALGPCVVLSFLFVGFGSAEVNDNVVYPQDEEQ